MSEPEANRKPLSIRTPSPPTRLRPKFRLAAPPCALEWCRYTVDPAVTSPVLRRPPTSVQRTNATDALLATSTARSPSTIVCGTLAMGRGVSLLPELAVVHRTSPHFEESREEVRAVVGPDVELAVQKSHAGVRFDSATPLFDTIAELLREVEPGCVPVPYMIPGFTDAFAYARLGAVCYGFSPVRLPRGLEFQRLYHGDDERIPIDGFRWGLRVLYEVVRRACS